MNIFEPIDKLLESRHETMLQWCEPWPACGPEGNDLDALVNHRATVHDCINMSRRAAKAAGRPTMGDDANHLMDFIAVHWANVVEETIPTPQSQPPSPSSLPQTGP